MTIKLYPESQFPVIEHIDNVKIFGAIYNSLVELSENKAEEFKKKVESGKIRISSTFPYVGEYLLPKPMLPLARDIRGRLNDSKFEKSEVIKATKCLKDFKKEKYISLDDFEKVINDGCYTWDSINKILENAKKRQSKFGFKRIERPRNTLNRLTQQSTIFYEEYCSIERSDSGFYFIISCEDNDFTEYFKPALNFLKDRGIGANYSIGIGKFKWEKDRIEIKYPENSTYNVLLSKCFVESLQGVDGYWQLSEIKGFTRDGEHFSGIYYLREGSIINPKLDGKIFIVKGSKKLINLTPFYISTNFERE